jgi:hypothetical protein
MAKGKLSFEGFGEQSFNIPNEIKTEPNTIETSKNIPNKFDADHAVQHSLKKKTKLYEYKKTFEGSVDKDGPRSTAVLYNKNYERIGLLESLNKDLTRLDILNFIVDDFFKRHVDEIKDEYDQLQKNVKNIF